MAEQKTLDKRVEAEMVKIAGMQGVYQAYQEASRKGDEERQGDLDNIAIRVILQGRDPKKDPKFQEDLQTLEDQFYCSGKDALKTIKDHLSSTIHSIEEAYKGSQDIIYRTVEASLNSALDGAENKEDAVSRIMYALGPALRAVTRINMTQEGADEAYYTEFTSRTRVIPRRARSGVGNIEEAVNLQYKILSSEYLVEKKDRNGKTTYVVDEKKLKELVENPLTGSILYHSKPQKKK